MPLPLPLPHRLTQPPPRPRRTTQHLLSLRPCIQTCLQPFHLILNLALGSPNTAFTAINGVGITDEQLLATMTSGVPKQMAVDFVRVWRCSAAPGAPACVKPAA